MRGVMSKTYKNLPKATKEMWEVFKRKSGPQIRPTSRSKEREQWMKEWEEGERNAVD